MLLALLGEMLQVELCAFAGERGARLSRVVIEEMLVRN